MAIFITMPTLAIIVLGGINAVKDPESPLVINQVEMAGINFLAQNSKPGDIVLASPQTGSIVPAYTGLKVVYGHPFETVNALTEKALVEQFFTNSFNEESLVWAKTRGVDWVIWGPNENRIGEIPAKLPGDVLLVFKGLDIQVYKLMDVP